MRRPAISAGSTRVWAAAALAALSMGCSSESNDAVRRLYEVAPTKAVCSSFAGYHLCLQVREPGEQEWTFMFETPRFFEFEWGAATRIVVEEEEIDPPLLDVGSIRRTLVRVESRDTVPSDTTFTLQVPGRWTFVNDAGDYYIGMPTDAFTCAGAVCGGLDAALDDEDGSVLITLSLPDSTGAPLEVVSWTPCSAPWPQCSP